MPQIYKSPDIGISVLYALVLNSEMDKIDQELYQKIALDYFCKDEKFIHQLQSKQLNPSKCVKLAKCMRFLRIYRQPNTSEEQFTAIKDIEDLALDSFSASDMK